MRPLLEVALMGIGEAPPIDFQAELTPNRLRLPPGATVPVSLRLRNLSDTLLSVRTVRTEVLLPDGESFVLGGLAHGSTLLPGDQERALPTTVFLPEAAFDSLGRQAGPARFIQTLVGTANGVEIERQAEASLVPVGSLGSELTVHTVSVEFPFPGTTVRQGAVLRARARLFGRGIGTAFGRWLVNGTEFETATVDIESSGGVVETLASLPTAFVGRHEVTFEVLEPVPIRSPAVRYGVTGRNTEGLRWLAPTAMGAYLRSEAPPRLAWTPRAGATYHLEIDGESVARPTTPSWSADPPLWSRLTSGTRTLVVRAVIGDPDRPLFEERLERSMIVLDEPAPLTARCDADACQWSGGPAGSLYAITWRDADGATVYRRISARDRLLRSSLAGLLPHDAELTWTVEARNDRDDVVGRGPESAWPGGER